MISDDELDEEDDKKWDAVAREAVAQAELEERCAGRQGEASKGPPKTSLWCSVCADDAELRCSGEKITY